jgi:small subunit ribosomal protein S4
MARYHGPKCRLCRREGLKLFLKGLKCNTAKCPIEKRSKPPGMHGWHRGRPGDYGIRLREKQKLKRYYGVLEQQFRRYFDKARKRVGNTGESLLVMLERRLDNVLTVGGFAVSRAQARQLVTHGHVQINGRTVNVPNYQVAEGDVIRPEQVESTLEQVRLHREQSAHPQSAWLDINETDLTVRVVRMPVREDVTIEIEEGLVVELCSR